MQFVDLKKQYQTYREEIQTAINGVMENTAFVLGPQLKQLEETLAGYVGVQTAVGCSSGTDALVLALMAYGVGPGDEVITTPFTFIATAEAIALCGAKPVFVDIRNDTCNIDVKKIESAISPQTKGIIAVDMFGHCADYEEITALAKKSNLFVIEDAAQAFGADYNGKKACSFGDIGCTSFFPAKTLGCYGDGGMVFTDDTELANRLRSIRNHGSGKDKYDNIRLGLNARLDNLQAAILLVKFKYFEQEIEKRRKAARHYDEHLNGLVETPQTLAGHVSAYCYYCIRVDNRDQVQPALKEKGIPTQIYYPKPLHLQKTFETLGYKPGDCPVAETIADRILGLPMHPFLSVDEQNMIIDALKGVVVKK